MAPDAGSAQPFAAPRTVEERPPPGLARGKYPVPAWSVGALGGVVLLLGLLYAIWRFRRTRARLSEP